MDYITIVEEILQVYNINATEFARRIDVQRSSISHILSGRNNPSLDMLIKIKENFPELNWDYLLLGKKPMTASEINKIEEKERGRQAELFEPDIPPTLPIDSNTQSQIAQLSINEGKSISKIIWFYDDHTFEVFNA